MFSLTCQRPKKALVISILSSCFLFPQFQKEPGIHFHSLGGRGTSGQGHTADLTRRNETTSHFDVLGTPSLKNRKGKVTRFSIPNGELLESQLLSKAGFLEP